MPTSKRWTVDILLDEHDEGRTTRAEARLHTGDSTNVRGIGRSWRNPRDPEVPEIGDELAAARALADLADRLRTLAREDIEAIADDGATHGW
jgi:hypothetical protein